jgi:hypothetical protein
MSLKLTTAYIVATFDTAVFEDGCQLFDIAGSRVTFKRTIDPTTAREPVLIH